jgi:PPOX class probable F420-dependent enzyme
MQLTDERIVQLLHTWPVARLATRNHSDQLKQVPIVFAYHQGKLWSPIDGKPKKGRELSRIENALEHPQASLLLDEYSDDWQQLWWLQLDVSLQVVGLDNEQSTEIIAAANAAVTALEEKYPQYQTVPVLREPPTLLIISINKISSWCFKETNPSREA